MAPQPETRKMNIVTFVCDHMEPTAAVLLKQLTIDIVAGFPDYMLQQLHIRRI
jgi:hypothetical protein